MWGFGRKRCCVVSEVFFFSRTWGRDGLILQYIEERKVARVDVLKEYLMLILVYFGSYG